MKSNLIVPVLALAATAVVSSADAAQTNSSGSDFHAYNASEATVIDYLSNGVRTLSAYPTSVIGSVDHNPSTNGQVIYIDGYHSGVQTTSCTLYSYNYNGTLLAASSVSASGMSGAWERTVYLTAAQSTAWAYYSLLCQIPANGAGVLLGATSS